MPNKFSDLLRSTAYQLASKSSESEDWFSDSVTSMQKRDPKKIFQKSSSPKIGQMFLFMYDPKTKQKLPFYDMYPLVFPIDMYAGGFLGLNLHYLPPLARVQLMKSLIDVNEIDKYTELKKLNLSYDLLSRYSNQLRGMNNCLKRYLYGHVRSSFHLVDVQDWEKAAMLPLQKWKINSNKAYAGSPPY